MKKPNIRCALLAVLIAKHRWGSPLTEENLLDFAAIDPNRYPEAKDTIDDLRDEPYVDDEGKRGLQLNNSEFGELADVLYYECEWEPFEIRSRLKHYEGWDNHEWA